MDVFNLHFDCILEGSSGCAGGDEGGCGSNGSETVRTAIIRHTVTLNMPHTIRTVQKFPVRTTWKEL
jgi:hypothetical protein